MIKFASRLCVGAVVLFACLLSQPAKAAGDPSLVWYTLETAHFRIHYPHPLERVARRVAVVGEAAHSRLTVDLAYTPDSRTELVITDDSDQANGSATSIPFNAIRLFASAPPDISALGDHDDWMLTLVTHEYTHTLHIDNVSGLANVLNHIIGKQLTPNSAQPRWIIEGLATYYESRRTSGGRIRSSLFDMFLRADVLADNMARLDQVSNNPQRFPEGTIWYLYGSKFLAWIMGVYGPNTMTAVSADYGASTIPFGINRAIRRATGRTYVELYEGWTNHLREKYGEQVAEVKRRGIREGQRITFHGRQALYPVFVPVQARTDPQATELIYYREDGIHRAGMVRIALPTTPQSESPDSELVARTSGASSARFGPDGALVFDSTAVFKNVYARSDLWRLPVGETSPDGTESIRQRLTTGLRAAHPDVSSDGKHIAFTVNSAGTRYLQIADITPSLEIENRRDLVPSAEFDQAYTPQFSPNGKYVAYSVWTAGGFRDIRIVEVATGNYKSITKDRAMDMQPTWSPDGQTLYFSSDRTKILNIYAYSVATGQLKQVTNVRVGALCPAISPDGKTLVYTGYTTLGYDLYAMELDPARFLPAVEPPNDRPDPLPEPEPVAMVKSAYNPLPTLAPRSYNLELTQGFYDANALQISVEGSDIAGHHAVAAAVTIEGGAPAPRVTLDYTYGRLPVNLSMRLFHNVIPRGGLIVNGEEIAFDEHNTGITTGLSYPIAGLRAFDSHNVGFAYSASLFSGKLPIEGQALDPNGPRTVIPPEGLMATVSASYSYASLESASEAAGPVRGTSLRLDADYADDATGSDYSLRSFSYSLSQYVPMPWPGSHVLRLNSSGGVSGGNFPRRGLFFLGGHNLDDAGIVDILDGTFDSNFVIRGYEPGAYVGNEYLLSSLEYRAPLLTPDRGLSTLPLYMSRIDGALFVDYGGAFNDLRLEEIELFKDGQLIESPDLHAAIGGELWFALTVGHRLDTRLKLGYAYGFSHEAQKGGQVYFLGSGTF